MEFLCFFFFNLRAKREREREPLEVEDEQTQTSSPGGWQGRLSAFLHVHRGSRASSRKSSRASDGSDLSDLGGPWLNLPLLLLSGAAHQDPCITVSEPSPDESLPAVGPAQPPVRRRSFYNFFLKHQDAVETQHDDDVTSPLKHKGSLKQSGTMLGLHLTDESKPKRGSIIRKKPQIERGNSQPGLKVGNLGIGGPNSEVSILVTEASPEAPPLPVIPVPEPTLVHVLVHRESEEYGAEDNATDKNEKSPTNFELKS